MQATPDGDSAIDVSWDPPVDDGGSPIQYYEVQWSPDGTTSWRNAGRTTDGVTLTFKNTGMTFGTTRYYRVAAHNGVTPGEWSDPPVSATTLAGVPGQPNLTVRAKDANTIGLTWTVPADNGSPIIRYELEWSPDGSDGSWSRLTTPAAADTSYDDTPLDPGTERHYRIRAVNSATPGEGSWSTVRSAVTPPAVPGAPTLRAEANGQNAIDVIWEPPTDDGGADITGYELQWSADGTENSYSQLTSPPGTARSYTHPNLQPGDTRYYQIRARNRAGLGEFSEPAFATTLTGVPAAPSLTVQANGATEIKLSWTKPDDRGSEIYGYELQQSDDGTDWSTLSSNISAEDTEYVEMGLGAGSTKYYRIRAINLNGYGQWSQAKSARTDAGGPDAPGLTATGATDNRIDLSWTEPANNGSPIQGYWVERSLDGNAPWEQLTSNHPRTSYSDSSLYRGMTRYYRVAATNGAGTGPYSPVRSATTTGDPATAPSAPRLFRLSNVGSNQIAIAWKAPDDDGGAPVSGYEYQMNICKSGNCDFTDTVSNTTTSTSAMISGLTEDGLYLLKVRAVNAVGKGQWANTQHTLRPSTNGRVIVTPTTITLNEGSKFTYTIRLATQPPHPVTVLALPERGRSNSDLKADGDFSLLVPDNWTHPDPDRDWSNVIAEWDQGVTVTFTAPEDSDSDDGVAVITNWVQRLEYDTYKPCDHKPEAEQAQCKQDWEKAWNTSPYLRLSGASVLVTIRDND